MADVRERIEEANAEAVRRMTAGDPVLVDVVPAGQAIPALRGPEKRILHSGPPVSWDRMCGAQRGSMMGIALFEGWAKTPEEAEELLASGEVRFEPNHGHGAVGPMAGTISPPFRCSLWRTGRSGTEPAAGRWRTASSSGISARRRWGRSRSGGTCSAPRSGRRSASVGVNLKPLIARALEMGDELHNRQVAASSLLANALSVPLVEAGLPQDQLLATLRLLVNHPVFFLAPAMAAAKAIADPARGIPYSTVVTAMARNGTQFGIQVSSLGEEWFTAPAPVWKGSSFPATSRRTQAWTWGTRRSPRPWAGGVRPRGPRGS